MLLAATVLVLSMTGAAIAAPVNVTHDRSDNSMSFTYDADSGTMPVATSSERISRHDPVSFELTMTPTRRRVVGRIYLKLLSSRPRRMRGRFTVVVTDEDGAVITRKSLHRLVVLHPQRHGRSATLRIPVRLASGSYGAFARFTSG